MTGMGNWNIAVLSEKSSLKPDFSSIWTPSRTWFTSRCLSFSRDAHGTSWGGHWGQLEAGVGCSREARPVQLRRPLQPALPVFITCWSTSRLGLQSLLQPHGVVPSASLCCCPVSPSSPSCSEVHVPYNSFSSVLRGKGAAFRMHCLCVPKSTNEIIVLANWIRVCLPRYLAT